LSTDDEILGTFFGSDEFPVEWSSDAERSLFWVYDDLHCPHPVSPMFLDIGGWWLSCDHMFRRFGTPFAVDWIVKAVNGWVYTAAIPARAGLRVDGHEYGARYGARTPLDESYPERIGAYLDAVLPTYGQHFETWWRERLVPEMARNFEYLQAKLDRQSELTLPELAVLLEDAIDIHDRHWKIHWMLNFAQLSATLKVRSVMEKVHGRVDDVLLGRLQNSVNDRNWDSIEALWRMKEEAKADPELGDLLRAGTTPEAVAALRGSQRGRRFIDERVTPYQREFGWHAVWSHEFVFPDVVEDLTPVIELVRGYLDTDYDYPATIEALRADIDAAAAEILEGLEGDALEEMRAANEMNMRMAPLTPDHHFYIDQGSNAHLRQVLLAIGRKLVDAGALDRPDDVIFLRYQQLRYLIGDVAGFDARSIVAEARAERERQYGTRPPDWIGTATKESLAFPYLVNWGFPEKFDRAASGDADAITGIAGSPGTVEGIARVVLHEEQFDEVRAGDILVCQMTNPAWVVLFTKIAGLVTDAGGPTAHPAVLSREFGIPAVVGASVATRHIATGDRIRVDGSSGTVEVLERAGGTQRKTDDLLRV
jgi:phosphohistidine swiveling domain-containing protein